VGESFHVLLTFTNRFIHSDNPTMIPIRLVRLVSLLVLLISTSQGETRSGIFKHSSVLSKTVDLRGKEKKLSKKPKAVAKPSKAAEGHHAEELMSAPTAIANVLADLCPHGMLPIGTHSTLHCRLSALRSAVLTLCSNTV